jgi:hypothetical protein
MDVRLSLDPASDGYGMAPCMICAAPCSAAIVVNGQTAFACRLHVTDVDRLMLAHLSAPVPAAG